MSAEKKIIITFPDGNQKSYASGITGLQLATEISPQLAKKTLAIEMNGEVKDLSTRLEQDGTIRLLTWDEEEGKSVFWHSTAHLMAEALEALYPNIGLGIGPPIAEGFYYDIDFRDYDFDPSHLPRVEKKMQELACLKSNFVRIPMGKQEAIDFYKKKGNPYKLEILERLKDGEITFYEQGKFIDLCKGPHIPHTGHIKAFKLTNIAGAYWMGDVERKQLTRIYGVSFPKATLLEAYLHKKKEAKKRDHRTLGKALKLFTFSDEVGNGLPLWLPKGAFIRTRLIEFLHEMQQKGGYHSVITPHIAHKQLYITSGHYEKYGADAFRPIQTPHQGEEFMLKPMNCPHHCVIYKSSPKSYRELPLRLAEFGTVYRYEQHGELHGLSRTRGFTQDDAHIFCTPDQVKEEFVQVIHLVLKVLKAFSFTDYEMQVSLRDPEQKTKYIGNEEQWTKAEKAIQEAVEEQGIKAQVVEGEAAFYGPKLDFMVRDALGRSWQMGTVQLDYQLPERFGLTYIGEDNEKHRPVMIHRAPFGSLERFIAILLEHTSGKLPLWLLPVQVAILPIGDTHIPYAEKIAQELKGKGIRSQVDHRSEKVGRKIRDTEMDKVPYMLLVGNEEVKQKEVALRVQGKGDQGRMSLKNFIALIRPDLSF